MPPPTTTYQLGIALQETRPPVWRRVLVLPALPLARLHDVIQAVMGWDDCHLHMFIDGDRRFTRRDRSLDDWTPPGMSRDLDESRYRVRHLLEKEGDWIEYEYDFGDCWRHRITLQKVLPRDRNIRLPACTGGKRQCPPEDCGGAWGFQNMLEALGDPNHEDHEELTDWIGEFDPEAFSVQAANARLRYVFR